MRLRFLLGLVPLLLATQVYAAGSSVVWTAPATGTVGVERYQKNYQAVVTSDDADGTASGAITIGGVAVNLNGYLVRIVTDPAAAALAPSASWGCTLLGPLGEDVLGSAILSNRSATVSQSAYALDPRPRWVLHLS
jgi:hypothetical protein